jgi:hypothetical protein
MNTIKKITLLIICFIIGTLYFAFNQGWIVIRSFSITAQADQATNALRATKKQMNLVFWNNNKWNKESVEIITTSDTAQTVQYLLNSWLTLLDEENVMAKKVTLQSALMSAHGQLYISFDRNPFDENSPTHDKWMWVEGLLTTIRENEPSVHKIHFLVHHHPMEDTHLDFSNPWPITGFLNK